MFCVTNDDEIIKVTSQRKASSKIFFQWITYFWLFIYFKDWRIYQVRNGVSASCVRVNTRLIMITINNHVIKTIKQWKIHELARLQRPLILGRIGI